MPLYKFFLVCRGSQILTPTCVFRLLKYALDGIEIRLQDMRSAIIGVSSNPVGRLIAWEFYKENFERIVKRLVYSPRYFASRCCVASCRVPLRCVALRCVALRCVALRCVALCSIVL